MVVQSFIKRTYYHAQYFQKLLVFFYYKPVPRPGTSPKWMAELENEDIGLLQGDFNQIQFKFVDQGSKFCSQMENKN